VKILCRLLGCEPSNYAPCCERCGAGVYEPEFREWQDGWLTPPIRLYYAVKHWCWPRCLHCRTRLWPWRRVPASWDAGGGFCSAACVEKWVPF
jgi:hypothetical protein